MLEPTLQMWLTHYSTSRAVSRKPGVSGCTSHFERMLYDNAQLARVYLHAWQVAGTEFFRTITEKILDYVMREMPDRQGGFCSTQDADSEGVEGKFFVWAPDEIREILGKEASPLPSGEDGRAAAAPSWPPTASPQVAISRARKSWSCWAR